MIFATLKNHIKKPVIVGLASLLLIFVLWSVYLIFGNATTRSNKVQIRIRKGWNLTQLADTLSSKVGLKHPGLFVFVAKNTGYKSPRPCSIHVLPGDNLIDIVNRLKENRNQTVNIAIRGSMDANQLAVLFSSKLEVDKDSFLAMLKNTKILREFDVTDTTWASLFIPNTYNMYAATDLNNLMERMKKEYELFWNSKRKELSIRQGLTFKEVITLASIVTKESNKTDEYEKIAGVYLNRLRMGMPLQADPTVVFARGRAGRVWAADLKIQSPYNTYLRSGLPPGPICIPNLQSIEAVLQYRSHNYLYFCARADLSGYHDFAATLAEHNRNAADFHRALNEKGIK